MLRFGQAPYLECSSKGEARLSAFKARLRARDNASIEELYQAAKVFQDGSTGLSWRDAKGKTAVNVEECRALYSRLWNEYFIENPDLFDLFFHYRGFSDIFGQAGHACQAEEIYRIYKDWLTWA